MGPFLKTWANKGRGLEFILGGGQLLDRQMRPTGRYPKFDVWIDIGGHPASLPVGRYGLRKNQLYGPLGIFSWSGLYCILGSSAFTGNSCLPMPTLSQSTRGPATPKAAWLYGVTRCS